MKKAVFTFLVVSIIFLFGSSIIAQSIEEPCPCKGPSSLSPEEIQKLIQQNTPQIGRSNLEMPADFSSGNGNRDGLDSRGTDFWLLFMRNLDGTGSSLFLDITCGENASGTISIPGIGFNTNFNVVANTVTRVNIPSNANIVNSGVVTNVGIHIIADKEVTVYGMNRRENSTDGFLGLPVDVLGTSYLMMTYPALTWGGFGTSPGWAPEFAVVSPFDNNIVTITPKDDTYNGNPAGVPFNVTLNQGEAYLVIGRMSASYNADQTGSVISSTLPVAVFSGSSCASVPQGFAACDHLVEQIPPTSTWGETFVTRQLEGRNSGDTWRFLASQNGTQLTINGVNVATLNFGDFYETVLTSSSYIVADHPILAVQFSNSSNYDGVVSDPFMMVVPPYQQFLGDYIFATPGSGFVTNYLTSAVNTAGIAGMQLNGAPIPAANYSPIGATGYSAAGLPISINTSYLINNTSGYPSGLYVYGFDSYDSYGYPGGQAFGAIATVTTLDLTPVNGTAQIGTNQCWQAEVLDQFSAPVPGVRVDFNLTGAHTGTSGFGFTDINGIATYCFVGVNTGVDAVVANVSLLSDNAQFTWTPVGPPVPLSDWAIYLGIFLAVGFVVIRYRKMI